MTEDSNNAVSNSFLLDDDSRLVTVLGLLTNANKFGLVWFGSVTFFLITF